MIDLRQGDCLELMKSMPDGYVDLIITSPPYNLGKRHHTGNNTFCPYEGYVDDMPEEEYQLWQCEILAECFRVLKDTGSMWYNHKNRIRKGQQIEPYRWIYRTPFVVKQEVVWFNRSQNFDKIRFYPMTERLYWLVKDPKTKMFNAISHHDVFDAKEWTPVGTKGEHRRAFPVKMVEDILQCFPDAKIILDPFIGSGTTAVAAVNTNRDCIGFDIDGRNIEIAEKRVAEAISVGMRCKE